jgi:aspartate kinase
MAGQRVLKFGGAALCDGPSVRRACRIIVERGGPAPVVVVSAHEGVTDLLVQVTEAAAAGRREESRVRIRHRSLLAQLGLDPELCDRYLAELGQLLDRVRAQGEVRPSELDFALSFGERISARIVARSLQEIGQAATPVDAWDLGLVTDSRFGGARPIEGTLAAISAAVEEVPGVAVVTGFLAKDRQGNLTTLGRNGSDLTAAILAEAVGASELVFWKSVPGIMTADPVLVPDPHIVPSLSYAGAAELAFLGARVLHPASIAPAVRAGIRVRVQSVFDPDSPGTLLTPEADHPGPRSIASKREVWRIEQDIDSPDRRGERVAALFRRLERAGVVPGLISSGGERIGALVDPGPAAERVVAESDSTRTRLERGLALVAVVGESVGGDRLLGESALDCLRSARVEVREAWIGARLCSQAFLLAEHELPRAAHALHEALIGGRFATVRDA